MHTVRSIVQSLLSGLGKCVLLVILPNVSTLASPVQVGDIVFSQLSPGINVLQIDNFTGSNNLGFFPVADNLTFASPTVTIFCANAQCVTDLGAASKIFNLADLTPSIGSDTSTLLSAADQISQLVFNAILVDGAQGPGLLTVKLSDGTSIQTAPTLSATLLPSIGSFLIAGDPVAGTSGDTISLEISASGTTTVPEPGTLALVFLGLSALAAGRWATRRHHAYQPHGVAQPRT